MSAAEERQVKLQFVVNKVDEERLNAIARQCGLESAEDVLRAAVDFLKWSVERIRAGQVIGSAEKLPPEACRPALTALDRAREYGVRERAHAAEGAIEYLI